MSGSQKTGTLGFKFNWVTNARTAFEKVNHQQDKMMILFCPLGVL